MMMNESATTHIINDNIDGSFQTFHPQNSFPHSTIDSCGNTISHCGQHEALKKVSIVDCGSAQEMIPNGQPFHIENEYFSGEVMLMIRTPDVDNSAEPKPLGEVPATISNYFKDYKRRFEFQFQIQFKQLPKGPLFLGCETASTIKVPRLTRGLVGLILGMIKRINSGFHYSFGSKHLTDEQIRCGDYEKTHLSFPVEASMDRVVVTKPGSDAPILGQELHESPESVRRRRRMGFGSVDWNTEDTFTMCLWNAYMDWIKWKTMNVPGCRPFPLSNVTGSQPVYLCVYELANVTPHEYRKQEPCHFQKSLRHYARIEFAHEDVTTGGIAPRFNSQNIRNRSCVDTDSELGSEHSIFSECCTGTNDCV
ncbi:unnamed protein product [Cylindrotheca closterium]|uniref:Domain of unknown function at the cortex 1 domain-containing protein n=1 Tax=Cylindrotheca closterium TaxID=2856 RepID=A0AAD2CT17_9STRA|nr:unnamed protein product [Cylindrotheca closterium]